MDEQINALPAPVCLLSSDLRPPTCGPFERVVSTDQRPGETDVSVRCLGCQACAHYVLDAAGSVMDEEGLRAHRTP